MAFMDLLPAILGGAAAIFGGNGGGTDVTEVSPRGPNIPGGQLLEGIGAMRSNATLPYTAGPHRTMDFGRGLYSPVQQTPQFQPSPGQSTFNPGYGGGYSPGTQSNYQSTGINPLSLANMVQPIYGSPFGGQQSGGSTATVLGGPGPVPPSASGMAGGAAPLVRAAPGPFGAGQPSPGGTGGGFGGSTQGGMVQNPGPPGNATGSQYPLPPSPSQGLQEAFAPPIFRDPFVSGINAAAQSGSFQAQALPGAGNFQASLYDPNMNAFEASYLGAGANLGLRGLESNLNQIDSQYENTPFHTSRGQQRDEAAQMFANNMMQTAGQMGMQRQQLATGNLQNAFNGPLQANQAGQQSAAGLYNLFANAMYGDLQFPTTMYQSYPVQGSTFIQERTA